MVGLDPTIHAVPSTPAVGRTALSSVSLGKRNGVDTRVKPAHDRSE